jgi:hypothetical protein
MTHIAGKRNGIDNDSASPASAGFPMPATQPWKSNHAVLQSRRAN